MLSLKKDQILKVFTPATLTTNYNINPIAHHNVK